MMDIPLPCKRNILESLLANMSSHLMSSDYPNILTTSLLLCIRGWGRGGGGEVAEFASGEYGVSSHYSIIR